MGASNLFSVDDARRIGTELGIDWDVSPFDVDQFLLGLGVEMEHGLHDAETNVTGNDPVLTGKIAYAHLNGAMGYPKDFGQARALFQQALDSGHEQARSGLAAVDRAEAAEKAAAERAAASGAEPVKPAGQ